MTSSSIDIVIILHENAIKSRHWIGNIILFLLLDFSMVLDRHFYIFFVKFISSPSELTVTRRDIIDDLDCSVVDICTTRGT